MMSPVPFQIWLRSRFGRQHGLVRTQTLFGRLSTTCVNTRVAALFWYLGPRDSATHIQSWYYPS